MVTMLPVVQQNVRTLVYHVQEILFVTVINPSISCFMNDLIWSSEKCTKPDSEVPLSHGPYIQIQGKRLLHRMKRKNLEREKGCWNNDALIFI